MKKLFFGLILFFAALTQGWGSNQCSGTTDFTFSTSGINTVFSDSISDNNFDNGDIKYYYFSVPNAGTITFNRIDSASLSYKYSNSSCPSWGWFWSIGTTLNDGDTIVFNGAEDFNFAISALSNNQKYNFTLTFTPAAPSISNVSVTNIAVTSATINGTPSVSGTMYYVVTTSATAPTVAQVKAGQDNTGAAALFSGNSAVASGIQKSFNLTGLTTLTTYYGYLVLTDSGSVNSGAYTTGAFIPSNEVVINVGERTFNIRDKRNVNGNVAVIGNTVLCNQDAGGQCINDDYGQANDQLNLKYIDVGEETIARTYNNSSRAQLSIPDTAVVKWAGIYTQGYLNGNNQTTIGNALKDYVYVTVPTVGTIASKPTVIDMIGNGGDGYTYDTFAPLDDLVGKTGAQINGWVTGANIKADTGTENDGLGNYGAWTLVVVYDDGTSSLKNVTVFDGYKKVANETGYTTVEIPVSGFLTPSNGKVKSTLSVFAGEGDKNIEGDTLSLKAGSGSYVSINSTNAFYSTLMGVTASPSYTNTQGIDIQNHDVGIDDDTSLHKQIIGTNVTSATIKLTSTQDKYFPSMVAFATEIYQPFIKLTKVSDSSDELASGQKVTYEATIKNTGNEIASNINVYDNFTTNLQYIANKNPAQVSDPHVYLSDLIDGDTTKILNSIRLTAVNGATFTYCPAGVSAADCTTSTTVCSVTTVTNTEDTTRDPLVTGPMVQCTIPQLGIGSSVKMRFSTEISINAVKNTQSQDIDVTNQMAATYNNAITGEIVPSTAFSDTASAGIVYGAYVAGFNAWETAYKTYVSPGIYTKLYNTAFTLSVGTSNAFNGGVCAAVVDSSGNILPGGSYQCQDYSNVASKEFSWTITQAQKIARVNIKSKKYTVTNGTVPSDWSGWVSNDSTDNFAIRPLYFSISSTAVPLVVQKAGDDSGRVAINTDAVGYNQNASKLTATIAQWKDLIGNNISTPSSPPYTITGLAVGGANFSSTTGNSDGIAFSFPDVGRFDIDLKDVEWASSSGDISNDCRTDATAANANTLTNGKYGCYVMLDPTKTVNLRFIPYEFVITNASLTNAQTNFTYFSDNLNEQAATIPMTITTVNKSGVTTVNYASGLYEQAITLTPTGLSPDGYTPVSSVANGAILGFNDGSKTLSATDANAIKFNFSRNYSTPLTPLTINGSNTSIAVTDTDNVNGSVVPSGSASFLYGRVHMPNTSANAGDTVRVFAEVYATSSSSLPGGTTWVNAPGSTTWWINSLDGASKINGAIARPSNVLDTTTSQFSITTPATMSGGKVSFALTGGLNDQQAVIHMDVPTYLWYGSNAYLYSASPSTNCSQHPCGKVEIFGTDIKQWYGAGDKKGDKAIQTVPKGKRAPKVNW